MNGVCPKTATLMRQIELGQQTPVLMADLPHDLC